MAINHTDELNKQMITDINYYQTKIKALKRYIAKQLRQKESIKAENTWLQHELNNVLLSGLINGEKFDT